jgi:signal transduction histidine kinase
VHDTSLGADRGQAALLRLVGELDRPETRQAGADRIAALLGGEGLLLFARDPELDVVLPAPGLVQVLRGAAQWTDFLDRCIRQGVHAGTVTGYDGTPSHASGCAIRDGTAAVLIGARPGSAGPEPLLPLLPLLGALFRAERSLAANAVRARTADDAAERAEVLTGALQQMRERLEAALMDAEAARKAARDRADLAEALAAELEVSAGQLQEQAAELEIMNDELSQRTEEAERARAEADMANSAKSQFLASMSHELRTPINAVIGYAELLRLGITGPVTQQQQDQLERIRASSAHLLSLIDDVLDLAKVEAGEMTVRMEPNALVDVVAEACALVTVQASARGITLENQCGASDAVYVGDEHRVRQILANLLSNATKFTEEGGRIVVRCRVESQRDAAVNGSADADGPWTCVTVEDTGIGIAADELEHVFEPFVQADSGPTRTHGGTGLGLTISRQLARLMGGDLTVRSTPGQGSCFTLWLPAAGRPA